MIETRNISPKHIAKLGIDDGGGFLKVSLGVLVKEPWIQVLQQNAF